MASMETNTEFCFICLDDIDSDLIFSVDNCDHRYCLNCIKQHIEVKLLDGKIPNCPYYLCKSQLPIDRCGKLLTSKLSFMWEERIKEDLTPIKDRVYCPYTNCSYLLSKTFLSLSCDESSGGSKRRCFRCGRFFCLHCKVPWHSNVSCTDYKKLHPNVDDDDDDDTKLKSLASLQGWRQCGKCKHMIELSHGCIKITCRCGNNFCYKCGEEWNMGLSHGKCWSTPLEGQCWAWFSTLGLAILLTGIVFLISYLLRGKDFLNEIFNLK